MSPTLRIGGPSYTLAFGRALAGVLCYLAARKQPVVHSDIKPGSILVGDDLARPTLVDFGSSVWLPASGPGLIPHSAFGTPGYAVPEQYPLSPADRR